MEKIIIIDNEVHRPTGHWTKQVHQLLRYLRELGVDYVPEPLGFDEQGLEVVSFIKGETSNLLSLSTSSINALASAAKLLRAYHDVSQNFLNSDSLPQDWMQSSKKPQEVICHNDFGPYNVVFNGEQAVGIIDFDTAYPGPRKWDIAYALYRFAPFRNRDNGGGLDGIENQILRARLFCKAYGLIEGKRVGMADLIIERLQDFIDVTVKFALEGNRKFELIVNAGLHLKYLKDIEYIKFYKQLIENGLTQFYS
jgi:hypothetical protein